MASWGMGSLPNSLGAGCGTSALVPLSWKGSDAHRACPLPGALSTCACNPAAAGRNTSYGCRWALSCQTGGSEVTQGRGSLHPREVTADLLCPHQDKCCPFTSLGDQQSALSRGLCPGSGSPAQSKLQVPVEGPALLSTHVRGFRTHPQYETSVHSVSG